MSPFYYDRIFFYMSANNIISLLTYLNNVNWYKQTVFHWRGEYLLVINIFPILKIYPWFRYIQSWRDVGSVMKRESSLLTYNLSPFLLSNSVRCKKAKSWLTCPIKTRRVGCSSYYSVVMNLTEPIQLWVIIMLLLVFCMVEYSKQN